MDRLAAAILACLVATLAAPCASPAAAATADPKVVIVVGPVGSEDDHYRRDANQVATEALKYTSNVVKVYTPNATWSRVRAAMQGASVFVYLGHGNGWPSPYPPFQELTKNGLGLDPSTGADGDRHVYYGADYIRENIRLAPNAVVLLYHLCYASGNTEGVAEGIPEGPLSDSKTRVDGYAAGFIDAGARAVFATGHPRHPVAYHIRQLFTTRLTMGEIFRNDPDWNGHLKGPYDSVRSPGLRFEMDPDASDGGFWRSLAGDLSMSAAKVTATSWVPTDAVPASLVAPGAAEVTDPAGVPLFADPTAAADPAAEPVATLAPATRLRLVAEGGPMADGTRIFVAEPLDGSVSGSVRATGLDPRDSSAPRVWYENHSTGMLSPNDDGVNDAFTVSFRLSEPLDVVLRAKDAAGTTMKAIRATGDLLRLDWWLQSSGELVPDGDYTWTLTGQDAWGNGGISLGGRFSVDHTAPVTSSELDATAGNEGWLRSAPVVTLRATDNRAGVASTRLVRDGKVIDYQDPVTVRGDGPHTVTYSSTDRVANKESSHQLSFKVDATKPVVAVALDGPAGVPGTFAGAVSATIATTDPTSGVSAVSATLDGTPVDPAAAFRIEGDGTHEVQVTAVDVAGNRVVARTTLLIDTVDPVLVAAPAPGARPTVSPNGDGVTDTVAIPFAVSEPATVRATITDGTGAVVRTLAATAHGDASLAWDGRTTAGTAAPDGGYAITLVASDPAGNASAPVATAVDVYAALASVARTPAAFYPQDGDRLAASASVSFRLLAPADASAAVVDAGGEVVRTLLPTTTLPAGPRTYAWDGRRTDGTFAPRGVYRFVVTATNGVQGASGSATVRADAFRLAASVSSAVRGRSFTLTVVTVERLSTTPRVTVSQPGRASWTVTMRKVAPKTWRVVVTPKSGATGTLVLTVSARDSAGGRNRSSVGLPLR